MVATRKRRRLFLHRPRRLHVVAAAGAFAATLLFLALVLLSTSPSSPQDSNITRQQRSSSSSSHPAPAENHCINTTAASLGEFGDMMMSMLPNNLAFTVFVPSPDSFRRVLGLRRPNDDGDDAATYAVVSRVLGFSAVPRHLRAADVPLHRNLESVSGLRISGWIRDDADGALVVNGVPSECVDIVKGEDIIVHVMGGVLMDAEFERSFSSEFEN
uniref:FAS1 domain-containing protein n=1 Tax=Leersia perrieri TaxID=77586 RepID=A0A0D9VRP5_9ORYZ